MEPFSMDFFENHDRWEWLSYEAKIIRLQIRMVKYIANFKA